MSHDVRPQDLRTCATRLVTDASQIDGGCDDAHGGVDLASSGVNGDPLVGALAGLAHAIAEVSRTTGSAVRTSAERLSDNAERYEADDAAAAQRLEGSVPEGGYGLPAFPAPAPARPGVGPSVQRGPWTGEPSIVTGPYAPGPSGPRGVPA